MANLSESKKLLRRLLNWLEDSGHILKSEAKIKLVWSRQYDAVNRNNPRAFCYTRPNDKTVYCSSALGRLPVHVQLGILLHEVGHITQRQFSGKDAEFNVDSWCASLPGVAYKYLDTVYVRDPSNEETIEIRFIESVSASFSSRIEHGSV
jgi:hypothetical protein